MANFTEQQKAQENLDHILRYGNIRGCRRRFLLRYFDEEYEKANCGNCDGCVAQTPLEISQTNLKIAKPKSSHLFTPNGTYNPILFNELRNVRTNEARKLNVPPYMIFGDKALREMATHFPQTSTAFLQISGVGDRKLSQFGKMFMSVIYPYLVKNKIKEEKPVYTGGTFEETKKLLLQKLSIEEIAKIRGLSVGTIIGHIEKIYTPDSKINIAYLKPPHERFEKITTAFKQVGDFTLAPTRVILGESYSYDELKLVRIFLKN